MAALSGGTLTLMDKSQELPAKVRTYIQWGWGWGCMWGSGVGYICSDGSRVVVDGCMGKWVHLYSCIMCTVV